MQGVRTPRPASTSKHEHVADLIHHAFTTFVSFFGSVARLHSAQSAWPHWPGCQELLPAPPERSGSSHRCSGSSVALSSLRALSARPVLPPPSAPRSSGAEARRRSRDKRRGRTRRHSKRSMWRETWRQAPALLAMWRSCGDTSSDDDEHNTGNTFLLLCADSSRLCCWPGSPTWMVLMVAVECRFALDVFTIARQDYPLADHDSFSLASWLFEVFFMKVHMNLTGFPQLRGSYVLACVPPRASSHVLGDAGPMRAWRLLASEARPSWLLIKTCWTKDFIEKNTQPAEAVGATKCSQKSASRRAGV